MRTKKMKVDELLNDPANVRKHDKRNIDAIKASLQRFGQQKPIVIDSKGIVVAGNGTLSAAKELGWKDISVVETKLEGVDATAYAVADNRTAELAVWDEDALAQTLASLQVDDSIDEIVTGFSEQEIKDLIDSSVGLDDIDEDEVPEVPEEAITQVGDLWLLGEHRLLCGDATSEADVERLMDGEKADLCLTDPPYGLGESKTTKNNYRSHHDSIENLEKIIQEAIPLVLNVSSVAVVTCGNTNQYKYPVPTWTMAWFVPAGVGMSCWGFCCWQPILCYGKDPKLANGKGSHPDAIVWTEASEKLDHPCIKPTKFWSWLLDRTSFVNQKVYDPFMGSGTTLIACEQLSRKCYGMEIDPLYCDVIVKRWENLTGKKAVRSE